MYENLMEEVVSPENYGKALECGNRRSGSARHRRDEDGGAEGTPTEALAEDSRQADGGDLHSESREAEGNSEAEWGHAQRLALLPRTRQVICGVPQIP